ncbi:NTP transferase domain-containing protein [Williamsia sp.]|uniref:nucleotidyltransferase family protein n=1 Tax=Williamsia sp. TaxID=1872085 RepID=UPI001A31DF4C|nr:NTP transferase domain-containing protein [Williamsia sp.]MBJ7289644.1 NTP transferase domain-containing protein [Williamsia sp.]
MAVLTGDERPADGRPAPDGSQPRTSPSEAAAGPLGAGKVVGVVLAAGAGTRYGMPKVLAEQGDWLRAAVVALADGGCDEVVVTLGAALVDVPVPARAVVVPRWADGLSESVRSGLIEAIRADCAGVALLVVDVPDTSAAVVRRVLDAAGARREALVRAVFGGRPGHPVYLGADHLAGVLTTITGDRGAGAYTDQRPDVVTVECGDLTSGRDRDFI